MKKLIAIILCVGAQIGYTQTQTGLDPLVDYRYTGVVVRDANGDIRRSSKPITAFKKKWPCPSTGLRTGACPGWAIDHVIPLACGGADAVYNMAWMPNTGKSCGADYCKDRYERKVYGGNNMGPACP